VNWGDDGPDETITGPFESGTPQTKSHTWTSEGTFTIKAKAFDINGASSGWSTTEIKIPRNRLLFVDVIESFYYKIPLLKKILNRLG
jgi:hypothetical protein